MWAIVLALWLMTAPAIAADQFDLVCKGQQRNLPAGRWKPYEVHYRIDLARMIYCRFDCHATETILAADAAKITFQLPESDRPAAYIIHDVSRTDGKWKYYLGGMSDAEGVCEPAPFSGLPAAKF